MGPSRRRATAFLGQVGTALTPSHSARRQDAPPLFVTSLGGSPPMEWIVADAVVPSTVTVAATTTFEPVLPDATALLGMGSVVILSIAAGLVWANAVVPVSRTKLALSKSRGEVKEYLDGLKDFVVESNGEDGNSTVVTASVSEDVAAEKPQLVKPDVGDGRDFERWLFSDWLNSRANIKTGRQKEPALPILKDAKWNSGDNPVLVTSALLMIGVIVASVTERVGSLVGSG